MKLHIIGVSGSGKSYIADTLSSKYNIPHYDLDNIFWDNSAEHYGIKNTVEKRDKELKDILKTESWIIEGVYYAWLMESFAQADTILVLDMPTYLYKYRIVKRYILRKLKYIKGKKETMQSLINLLKWTDEFKHHNLPELYEILHDYEHKVVICHTKTDINTFINHNI